MDPIEEDPVQESQAAQEAAQEAARAANTSIDERLIDRYEVLVEEVRKQLQAVQGVGEWIEEYGQLEETYGRALCKIAAWNVHPTGWIAEVDVAWDTARSAVEKIGKQHLGLAICVSQSIGKRLVEFSNQKRGELKQCVAAYRQALSEVNRARGSLDKAKQRYARAVDDADQALQARDRLASDSKDKNEPDKFLNKVLGKLTPESLSKLQDRAADAVAEVDYAENDYRQRIVAVNQAVEVFKQHMLQNLAMVRDIEASRLSFFRDSLMRLHQAIKGAADIMASLHAGLGDALMEFSAHIELLDETVAPDTAGSESKEPYEEAKHRAERESQTTTLLHRAHDALNGVDALRRFLLDICNCVADSSNAEANFSKGALRIIEKYAFMSFSSNSSQSRSTTRNGWMHSTGILQELSQAHSESASFMADTLYVLIAEFQDEQERLRKIHTDKYNNKVRLLESHRAALQKAYVRQTKLSKELRERTAALQRASDGNGSGGEGRSRLNTEESLGGDHSSEDTSEQTRTHDSSQSIDEIFLEQLQSQGQKVLHTFGLLETSDQRANRLESQLEQLRAASSACDQQVLVAEVKLQQETREACEEASAVLSTVTQTVNAGFAKLKHALNELATMQRDALERILQRLDTIWVELQRIDQAADLEWLLQRCINTPDSNVLGDIKEAVTFASMRTDRITLENARNNHNSNNREHSATRRPRSRISLPRRSRSNDPPQKTEQGGRKLGVSLQELPLFSTHKVNEQGGGRPASATQQNEASLVDLAVTLPTMQPIAFDDSRPRRATDFVESSPAHSDLVGELIDDSSVNFGSPHADGMSPGESITQMEDRPETAFDESPPYTAERERGDDEEAFHSSGDDSAKRAELTPRDPALLKFDIPEDEKILRSYVCAYYPRRGLPVHGKIIITQHYVCFTGWPNMRMQMPLAEVHSVEKSNSMFFVPNAIEISMDPTKESLFFASFLERDDCHDFLQRMIGIAQGLKKITGPAPELSAETSTQPAESPTAKSEESWSAELENALPLLPHDLKGWKELESTIFDDPEISRLLDANVDVSARSLVIKCWLDNGFYKNFLTKLGDTVLSVSPWAAAKEDPDDDFLSRSAGGLRFSQRRELRYEHPRTQMLFIGPKNATAEQRHYLLRLQAAAAPGSSSDGETEGFVACTLTDFSGIPFGDHFAVMACWLIYDTSTGATPTSRVVAGVRVFMRKQTVMKGRIRTGTDEEMKVMLEQWLAAAKGAATSQGGAGAIESPSDVAEAQPSPEAELVVSSTASTTTGTLDFLRGKAQGDVLLLCFICLLLLVIWRLSSFQHQLQSMHELAEQQSKVIQDLVQVLEALKQQHR